MAKLTKAQATAHRRAEQILTQDFLTDDDRDFVIEHWQESANHVNSAAGAFFTPPGLASDFTLDVGKPRRVIDLCAGIGSLSLTLWRHAHGFAPWDMELVCVEVNPAYVAVGKKILPDATWICASVFELPTNLGRFDAAISNPPFGRIDRAGGSGPRYKGGEFEYHVIDVAADLASYGVFILPQGSAGFAFSGRPSYETQRNRRLDAFEKQTGLELSAGAGIDCSCYQDGWRGAAPTVEIVTCDFPTPPEDAKDAPAGTLFDLPEAAA